LKAPCGTILDERTSAHHNQIAPVALYLLSNVLLVAETTKTRQTVKLTPLSSAKT